MTAGVPLNRSVPFAVLTFLTWTSYSATYAVFPDMVLLEKCAGLGISKENCNRGSDRFPQLQAEQAAASLQYMVLSNVPGLLVCAFLSQLSDKYGRRPLLVLGAVQGCFSYSLMAWKGLENTIVYACQIGLSFFGNIFIFTGIVFAALADAAHDSGLSEAARAQLFGRVEATIWVGQLVGPVCGGFVARYLGPQHAFALPAALSIVTLPLLLYLPVTASRGSQGGGCPHPAMGFAEVCKDRRCALLLLGLLLAQWAVNCAMQTWPLFCNEAFGWDVASIGALESTFFAANAAGLFLLLPRLTSVLCQRDILGLAAGCGALLFGLCGMATAGWQLFPIAMAGTGNAMLYPIVRSLISKSLGAELHGTGLGCVALVEMACQAIGPLATGELWRMLQASGLSLRLAWLLPALECVASLCCFLASQHRPVQPTSEGLCLPSHADQ